MAFTAPPSLGRTSRPYQSSFDTLPAGAVADQSNQTYPRDVAVDQASGDVYVVTRDNGLTNSGFVKVSRFTAAGAPDDFTAGPGAGTNSITVSNEPSVSIAVDNSGGPLSGSLYVAFRRSEPREEGIKVFANSGAGLGELHVELAGNIAVDQSNGALYVAAAPGPQASISRFLPSSPAAPIDNSDYALSGINTLGLNLKLAVDSGAVFVLQSFDGKAPLLNRYDASSFTAGFPDGSAVATIDTGPLVAGPSDVDVDPSTGEIYVDERDRIAVYGSDGRPLYSFGAAAYFGNQSPALAVKSAVSGPAANVYVADNQDGSREVDVFGPPNKVQTFTRPEIASFGPDGTSSSSFASQVLGQLAFDQESRRLYADDGGARVYGFDATNPPSFPLISGFDPLSAPTAKFGDLAVDSTALGSAGNVYRASPQTNRLYGWSSTGSPLGAPFPLDPAAIPGAPDGSPANICGSAVAPDGDVWVANSATQRILHYDSAGASLPGAIDTSAQGRPCEMAFDTNGDLYVVIGESTPADKTGVWRYTAASGYASASRITALAINGFFGTFIALDPATHHLFVAAGGCADDGAFLSVCNHAGWIDEYSADGALIDEFALALPSTVAARGIAVDATSHAVYLASESFATSPSFGRIRAFGPGVLLPEVAARPASGATNTTATLNGAVVTQGVVLDECHFEYVSEANFRLSGFSDLSTGGSVPCAPAAGSIPLDLDEHPVSAVAGGLSENTSYRFRLSATNANGSDTAVGSFTAAGRPLAETTGSPIRTATTAQLNARIIPSNAPVEYHFEYGEQGPCDANPCSATDPRPAGSGASMRFVAEEVKGLLPGTTYHYRVVADNGNAAGPATGRDMIVTTRPSDAPLSHGHFPGPPGSDRAYEQVSLPDTGGNPVSYAYAVSDDGERAFYRVSGGTPLSGAGSLLTPLYAERTETAPHQGGWRSENFYPPRSQLVGSAWIEPAGRTDLSDQVAQNVDTTSSRVAIWRLRPGQPAEKILAPSVADFRGPVVVSEDASRVLTFLRGTQDPAHPPPNNAANLYDVSSGTPRLVGLLPDGSVPTCGSLITGGGGAGAANVRRAPHWLSPDGSLVFFEICGELYMRDLVAEQTKLIVSSGSLVKSVPGAVFLSTGQSLDSIDGGGSDVYRYDLGDDTFDCVTCVVPGVAADVDTNNIAVAEDGSRVYFASPTALVPGATTAGIYRVNVASGDLAYVAPAANRVSDDSTVGNAVTGDGAVFVFASSNSNLNPLGGQRNGGALQFYRYDDRDRSLVCLSCPQDGGAAENPVSASTAFGSEGAGANRTALSADGATFAFATADPLLPADQNTARPGQKAGVGNDVYEWRDGRLLLISDGLTNWPDAGPRVSAITPSGSDVFFTAATQYTADAFDGYSRLYDARIGGGFEFPPPPKPCPLEVCQGTPKGAPEERAPGTGSFSGAGNSTQAKKPHRRKRHKKQHRKHRAKHDRRAHR